jgi:hypothetical protein
VANPRKVGLVIGALTISELFRNVSHEQFLQFCASIVREA